MPQRGSRPSINELDLYQNMVRGSALGKLIEDTVTSFNTNTWLDFANSYRDPPCLSPRISQLLHAAAELLGALRHFGAPVKLQQHWSEAELHQAINRGSHPSAHSYLHFVEDDMADMMRKWFWLVLPTHLARKIPGLHVSPMGVVPQRA